LMENSSINECSNSAWDFSTMKRQTAIFMSPWTRPDCTSLRCSLWLIRRVCYKIEDLSWSWIDLLSLGKYDEWCPLSAELKFFDKKDGRKRSLNATLSISSTNCTFNYTAELDLEGVRKSLS
jgi:hypothetical protein